MVQDSRGGADQSAARRHRTSTRLVLFAGSSWGRIFANFVITVYLTKVIMGELGVVLAGLFYMFSIMTRFILPLRSAISQVMTREAAAALAVGDRERVRRLFSNAVAIASLMAVTAMTGVALLAVFVVDVFAPPAMYPDAAEFARLARVAVVCEGMIAAGVLFFTPWMNLYIATQRVVAENIARTTERALDLVAVAIAFWVLPRIGVFAGAHPFVLFVVSRAVMRVGQQAMRAGIIRHLVRAARFRPGLVNRRDLRSIGAVGGWSLSNAAASLGFYAADQPFVYVYFGPVYNAIFAVVTRLQGMGQMLGGSLMFGVEGMAATHHHLGQHELNRRILLTSMRLTATVSAMCTAAVVLLCVPIVDLWLGKELRGDADLMAAMSYTDALRKVAGFALVLMPSVWFSQAMMVSMKVLYGMGLIRRYSPWLIQAAAAKLVLAWVGLQFFGAGPMWVLWSTVIAQLWCFGVMFPSLICRVFELRRRDLMTAVYVRPLLSIAAPSAALGAMVWAGPRWSLPLLIAAIGVGGVLYAPGFFFIGLDGPERRRIVELARSVVTKALRKARIRGLQRGAD